MTISSCEFAGQRDVGHHGSPELGQPKAPCRVRDGIFEAANSRFLPVGARCARRIGIIGLRNVQKSDVTEFVNLNGALPWAVAGFHLFDFHPQYEKSVSASPDVWEPLSYNISQMPTIVCESQAVPGKLVFGHSRSRSE